MIDDWLMAEVEVQNKISIFGDLLRFVTISQIEKVILMPNNINNNKNNNNYWINISNYT